MANLTTAVSFLWQTVTVVCCWPKAIMWIQVRTMDGQRSTQVDQLSKLTKIEELRIKLEAAFEVSPNMQRLFFRGKQVIYLAALWLLPELWIYFSRLCVKVNVLLHGKGFISLHSVPFLVWRRHKTLAIQNCTNVTVLAITKALCLVALFCSTVPPF